MPVELLAEPARTRTRISRVEPVSLSGDGVTVPKGTFYSGPQLVDRVYIPQGVADILFRYPTMVADERSFLLICKPRYVGQDGTIHEGRRPGDTLRALPVELMVRTGEGGGTQVSHDERRLGAVNAFLQANPAYHFIDVHTHPAALGAHYANNFSGGDIAQYEANAVVVPGYIAALATATRLKFWPDPSTQARVLEREAIEQLFPGFHRDSKTTLAGIISCDTPGGDNISKFLVV